VFRLVQNASSGSYMLSRTVQPACGLITLALIFSYTSARAQESTKVESERADVRILGIKRAAVLSTNRPYQAPPLISTRDAAKKEVTVTLEVKFATNEIDDVVCLDTGKLEDRKVRTRTYNGALVGGLIRAQPGDMLKVVLKNSIPKTEPDEPYKKNEPNGFNITNLHTHGLHVSPANNSDNVFLEIGPEESKQFCFDIPQDHIAGTFWYHAHRHGSTALQLTSGMAGPLLLEGGIDEVPEIAAAMKHDREKILVFQQITFSLDDTGMGQVTKADVYGDATARAKEVEECERYEATLINGINRPLIKMKPGEIQRWRCIHAGVMNKIPLSIVNAGDENDSLWLYEMALDGLPLYSIEKKKSVDLYPGYRSDFLVQAPTKPGKYLLKQRAVPRIEALNRVAQNESYLALVEVVDQPPVNMQLPDFHVTGAFAPRPIDYDELATRLPVPIVFEADEPRDFFVNGKEFDHGRVDRYAKLDTAEEWALSSAQDTHPFHIHVNPFEVIEKNGLHTRRYWKDTIVVTQRNPPWNPLYIRMRFEHFTGDTVLHCHNLVHEDRGMMMKVQIVGDGVKTRCETEESSTVAAASQEAPNWTLNDVDGRPHRLGDFKGENILLVFFRGTACAHCRAQLDMLSKHHELLKARRLKVVAISPESPAQLRQGLSDATFGLGDSLQLLSDELLGTFRSYGSHDGRALHGVFLIDRDGVIRWRHVGDEPLLEIDSILKQFDELEPMAKNRQ
jgi:FtsP/CotA-like multicopper oxidase with cupredoxin domain/peroxiredoxin